MASGSSSGEPLGSPTSFWLRLGDFLFTVVRLNAAIAVSCLPLVVMLVAPVDPLGAVPAVLIGAFLSSPGLAATFAAFRDMPGFEIGSGSIRDELSGSPAIARRYWGEEDTAVFRPFFRVWRRLAVRSLQVSALPLGLALVLVVDAVWAAQRSLGAVLTPMLVVLCTFCLPVWILALVLVTELTAGSWWSVVRAACACAARSWYLSLFSVGVLCVYGAGVILQPILVLLLASALALYLVWANSRWAALPVLRASAAGGHAGATGR